MHYLIDPSLQGVNRLFVLSFEHNTVRAGDTEYFFPKVILSEITLKHVIVLQNFLLIKEVITKNGQRIQQQKIKLE